MGEVNRNNYPELDKLLWDFHNIMIPAEQAFQVYEKRWDFVDQRQIEAIERQLLDELIQYYGNGIFMAA